MNHDMHMLLVILWWVCALLSYYFSMWMGWIPKPKPIKKIRKYTKDNPWGDEK